MVALPCPRDDLEGGNSALTKLLCTLTPAPGAVVALRAPWNQRFLPGEVTVPAIQQPHESTFGPD